MKQYIENAEGSGECNFYIITIIWIDQSKEITQDLRPAD